MIDAERVKKDIMHHLIKKNLIAKYLDIIIYQISIWSIFITTHYERAQIWPESDNQ